MKKKRRKKYWLRLDSNHWTSGCWITRKPLWSLGHHVLNTTLEQFTYKHFTCARQIKSARPLHDPGTGYWLVFVHHGPCTLQSVDSLFTIAPICDSSLFCYAVLFKCLFYLVGEERAGSFTLPSWCLVTVSEWWLSGWSSLCDCGISLSYSPLLSCSWREFFHSFFFRACSYFAHWLPTASRCQHRFQMINMTLESKAKVTCTKVCLITPNTNSIFISWPRLFMKVPGHCFDFGVEGQCQIC